MSSNPRPFDRRTFLKGAAVATAVAAAPARLRAGAQDAAKFKIEVWTDYTQGNDPGRNAAFAGTVELWNTQHPEMPVEVTALDPGEFKTTVPLAVESKNAGWLITADVGSANLLPWYHAGSIVPLDTYAQQYGWLAKDAGGAFAVANLGTKPSTVVSGGEIAGLPITYQPLVVFYNNGVFSAQGLTPPADWNGLIAALDKLKAAGSSPLAFGNAAQFHGLHVLSSLISANLDPTRYSSWWLGTDPNVKFTDPDFLWAAQTGQEWAKAGYFTEDFNAVNFDDALGAFMAGQQPMILTGDWNLAKINSGATFEVGAFPFPQHDTAIPWAVVKSPDWPFVMTSWCPQQDAAAQFLDFLTTPAVMDLFYEKAGVQPVFPFDTDKVTGSPLQGEVTAAIAGKQTGYYVDTVDPEVHSVMWPTSQQLFDGSLSPEDFAKQIQEAHEKALSG